MVARGSLPFLLFLLVLGLSSAPAVLAEAEQPTFVVVDPDGIYFGSGKHPKSPGVMSADEVWAEIPEYRRIIDEDLTEDDPVYHLLMKRATERFQKALKRLAKRDGYDMLGEVGAIEAKGDAEIPEVTRDMIDLVTRD